MRRLSLTIQGHKDIEESISKCRIWVHTQPMSMNLAKSGVLVNYDIAITYHMKSFPAVTVDMGSFGGSR